MSVSDNGGLNYDIEEIDIKYTGNRLWRPLDFIEIDLFPIQPSLIEILSS